MDRDSCRKILVTGAAGFIGGRIVERLYLDKLAEVRAGIHRWSSAPRIARFPVEIVECDILNRGSLLRAMEGSHAVVHCAYGDRTVNEQGTKNVLQAALEVGVDRLVHLSTVEVYGGVAGEVDESVSPKYFGNEYADSKLDAEKLCLEYGAKGVPVVILRPTVVYGPFSKYWTIAIAEQLLSGKWKMPEVADGYCQPVYVDDVVSAVLLTLEKDSAVGRTFNIAGGEVVKWREFFERFNSSMNLPPLKRQSGSSTYLKTIAMAPVRSVARYAMQKHPDLVKGILIKFRLEDFAKQVEVMIRTTSSLRQLALYSREAVYSIDAARNILGYSPSIDLARGLHLTALWLRHNGYAAICYPTELPFYTQA